MFSTVEVWDPSTRAWSSIAPLNTGRTDHATAVLSDGRVVVIGGSTVPTSATPSRGDILSTVEIWDPTNDTWGEWDGRFTARQGAVAVATTNDTVVLVGGARDYDGRITSYTFDAWLFEPDQNTWRRLQDSPKKIYWTNGAPLSNGDVYMLSYYGPGYWIELP